MSDTDDLEELLSAIPMHVDNQQSTAPVAVTGNNNGSTSSRWSGRKEKKRRVSTACIECRRRKSKCDGKSPCSGCQTKGLNCTMLFDDRRRKHSVAPTQTTSEPNDLQALKERCRYLERLLMTPNGAEDNSRRSSSASASASGGTSQMSARAATPPPRQSLIAPQPLNVPGQSSTVATFASTSSNSPPRHSPVGSIPIPLFDFGTNDAPHRQSDRSSSSMAPRQRQQSVQDSAKELQALSSTLNISNFSLWPGTTSVPNSSASMTFSQPSSLASGNVASTSQNTLPPPPAAVPTYSEISDKSASPAHNNARPIYVPPAQSLTEEDMLEPMPRTALETIHAGKATPSGIEAGSLAHQLTRRDGRMTLADGGRLRWYGATSSRSLSYGGLHFQNRGRKQIRELNATCRMALNRAGYAPDSIFEEYGFQQRIVS